MDHGTYSLQRRENPPKTADIDHVYARQTYYTICYSESEPHGMVHSTVNEQESR